MMIHFGFFFTLLALTMGAISVTFSLQLYKKFRLNFLRHHNQVFITFNVLGLLGLVLNYAQFNLASQLSKKDIFFILNGYHLILSTLSALLIYAFILLSFEILQREWPRRWRIFMQLLYGTLILLQGTCSFLDLRLAQFPIYLLFLIWIVLSVNIVAIVRMVRIYLYARSLKSRIKQKALKRYAVAVFVIFVLIFVLNLLQAFALIPLPPYVFLMAIILIGINVVPILTLNRFLKRLYPEKISLPADEIHQKNIFQKFAI